MEEKMANMTYDKNMIFIKLKDGNYICYSDELRKMIKVSEQTKKLIESYISNSEQLNIADRERICNLLKQAGLAFANTVDYQNKMFANKYKKMKEDISLRTAYIHMTQRCNLRCTYCYNRKNWKKRDELSTEQWLRIIDKLKKVGVCNFIFTGGETLIRKDLLEVIEYTKCDGNEVQVLTNGTLLDTQPKKFYEQIDALVVSMDALDEKKNNENRKNSGAYDIKSNLKQIPEEFKHKVFIRSVITKKNMDICYELRDEIERMGFRYISTIFLPNNLQEVESIPHIEFFEADDKDKMPFRNMIVNCGGCSKEIAIDSNGDIFPCQSLVDSEFYIGNILEENWYMDFCESKITQKFRCLNVFEIDKCRDCNIKFACGGGCRAIAYKVYGNISAHLEFFCDYLRRDALERLVNTSFITKEKE